jgi:hypothetical protein
MSWWAWLGLMLLAWTLFGVGLSVFLGLGIGEADRRRPRRVELTPEDITAPGTSPGLPLPRRPSGRRRRRRARVGGGPATGYGEDRSSPTERDRP